MNERTLIQPDIKFINYLKKNGGDTLKECYQCATCSVVCSLSPQDQAFPRKEMIAAGWGQKENLLADPDIWLCHGCADCSTYCPRGAKPGDVLGAIRTYAIEHFAFPKFLSSAIKQPRYLIPLLLIPFIILFFLLYNNLDGNFSQLNEGTVRFSRFLPHGILEAFFIGGNILIFAFAAIGLFRFWKNLNSISPPKQKSSFVGVLFTTITDIMAHKKFNTCSTNSSRFWGHLLIFYGFFGAMLTAGLAVGALVLYDMNPIPFFHPIKILGNLSGITMVVGCIIFTVHRLKTKSEKGRNTYSDWLLISFVFLVAITGLLTQSMRLLEIPFLAYNIYFVHMVFIFFLLWYAPYSKLAHMFYRTLAMVYLKMNNRDKKAAIFMSVLLITCFIKL
ncbi:MAG: quinone-interacting membrane-bound oxidoreductase complex subunit QmoC [Ignavibacteriaceae bacterium]